MSAKFERLPNEPLYESVIRWLRTRSAETGERALSNQGQSLCNSLAGDGAPQPVARLLDESEDIAIEYSKTFGQSPFADLAVIGFPTGGKTGREGKQKEDFAKKLSAPDVLRTIVDAGCETVIDSNRLGEKYCYGDTVGECIFCERRVCADCLKYEPCPSPTNTWHKVETA